MNKKAVVASRTSPLGACCGDHGRVSIPRSPISPLRRNRKQIWNAPTARFHPRPSSISRIVSGPDTPVLVRLRSGQVLAMAADPKTHEPYTDSLKMDSALPITRWSANTARMSIRRRISPKAESPWTRFRSNR